MRDSTDNGGIPHSLSTASALERVSIRGLRPLLNHRRGGDEPAYKPGLVVGDHLSKAARCRVAQATYPDASCEQHSDGVRSRRTGLLGLAPGGVYLAIPVTWDAGGLLHRRFTLTRCRAVCFLWHCPAGHPGWALPTTLLCGARTFLSPGWGRDHPADSSSGQYYPH